MLVVAAAVPLAARQPTFRSGVDLVTVDATVLGRDGVPIDDLGPDDFKLEVDGRPRRVVSAQFVSQAIRRNLPARAEPGHFSSNEWADAGRVIVLAVDEAHIRRLEGHQALKAAATFLDTLDPNDHAGVIGLTRVGTLALTRDRFALKRKLGTLLGQTDPVFLQFNLGLSEALEIAEGSRSRLADAVLRECGRSLTEYVNLARAADDAAGGRDACPEQVEQESRAVAQHANTQARISLSGLEALIASLKDIPGPKTVVLLSEGMVADPRRVDLARLSAEAHAARVAIYVLQLEAPIFEAAQERVSPTLSRDLQVRGDGVARVAGAARGAVFRLAGSDPRPFERIARELSGYYLLAFEPLESERDGRSHRIRVELARGGGELRSRNGFRLPAAASPAKTRDAALTALLRTMAASTELPLRVGTYTYAEPGSPNLRVVVSAEAEAGAGASAMLGFVLIDARGVIAATASREAGGGHYAFSTVVPPGSYTLRVAAIDPLGRHGSVERPFVARVTAAGGVRISDLILAPVPPRPNDPLQPFVDRVSGPALVAYLEMLADEGRPSPDAVRLVITAADAGTADVRATATVTPRSGGLAIARATVPIGELAPGRYVAIAEVVAGEQTIARVTRPFTIVAH
jgi:VWFA-related protein